MFAPTQPQRTITVLPTISPDSTLAELRSYREDALLLARQLNLIQDAQQIARWLGTPFDIENRPLWAGYRWSCDKVTVTLYEGTDRYLPGKKPGTGDYNKIRTLVVTVDGRRVAYIRESDDPRETNPDNFIVFGRWMNAITLSKAEAQHKAAGQGMDATERDRRELAGLLLVGVEV